jgi:hypothetical protein
MGNSSSSTSSSQNTNEVFQRYLNTLNMNNKYQFKRKVYKKTTFSKTIQVYDMIFKMPRILRQVKSN